MFYFNNNVLIYVALGFWFSSQLIYINIAKACKTKSGHDLLLYFNSERFILFLL